ncbi:MAG: ribosomal protein L7/L12 [Candidatus Shikimatogenerans sp. JK-2022]|nr:ribosomal protein L7/L12 [Candidatus Shikimatogenerans bostrichidophilus]
MKKIKNIAKELVNLNIKEINELYNLLEKKYKINLNINNLYNNNDKSNNNNINDNIKKKEIKQIKYDIYIKSLGTVKLPVIKYINKLTGKSLTESKKMIDVLPSLIKKSIDLDESKKLQDDFKKLDVEIELKESN